MEIRAAEERRECLTQLIWWQRRQAAASAAPEATPGLPAEQHFPVPIVALHGLLAVATVVLVLLAALEV